MKAYGITDRNGWARIELGDQVKETKRVEGANGLDPIWEEVFVFDVSDFIQICLKFIHYSYLYFQVADPDNDKFKVSLFFGETQIGLTAEYSLTGLIKMKLKYRGMAVPGGKVDPEDGLDHMGVRIL